MEKKRRARLILAHVLRLDERFGKNGPPRSINTTREARIISDDCRWHARVSPQYHDDKAGKHWDLLELTVYEEHRLTIVYHGDELEMRLFRAGPWEEIFLGFDPGDTTWLLPS
jgi:hypothetical protein